MNDRAKLDFGNLGDLDPPERLDPEVVKDTSAKAGFRQTTSAPAPRKPRAAKPVSPPRPAPADSPPVRRRTRRKTGRIHQFGTRLDKATIETIYAYADKHDILIAEVIEQAMAALQEAEKGRSH